MLLMEMWSFNGDAVSRLREAVERGRRLGIADRDLQDIEIRLSIPSDSDVYGVVDIGRRMVPVNRDGNGLLRLCMRDLAGRRRYLQPFIII